MKFNDIVALYAGWSHDDLCKTIESTTIKMMKSGEINSNDIQSLSEKIAAVARYHNGRIEFESQDAALFLQKLMFSNENPQEDSKVVSIWEDF